MSSWSNDWAVLRDRMGWDLPQNIEFKLVQVYRTHKLDKPCEACGVEPGQMCVTPKTRADRKVVHTERMLTS